MTAPSAILPPASWRTRVAVWLRQLAAALERRPQPAMLRGTLLNFRRTGVNLGRPIYIVSSVRGGFDMGRIEWSNQWHRAKFTPFADAVFDPQCIAEIYAQLRDLEGLR